MKVTEVMGTQSQQVHITLEPENPAEIALIQILHGAEATLESSVEEPKNGLLITATIKKAREVYGVSR